MVSDNSKKGGGIRQLFTILYATLQLINMYFHEWRNKMLLTTILLFQLMTFPFFPPYSYLLLWNTIFQLTWIALKKCNTKLLYASKVFPNPYILISTNSFTPFPVYAVIKTKTYFAINLQFIYIQILSTILFLDGYCFYGMYFESNSPPTRIEFQTQCLVVAFRFKNIVL